MAEQLRQVQEERNRQKLEEQERKRLEQHARYIESCDGSVREQVREWLDAITAAKRWTNTSNKSVIEMVGYLSKGALRTSIADYVEQNDPDDGATWEGVRDHVSNSFLDEDEAQHLRKKAENIKQAPYQDSREYGLKYMNAINKAYTQEPVTFLSQ